MTANEDSTQALLSLSGVSLVYRALPALKGIDWQFSAGQQWACLGPNGAGKTSLARVISGQATRFTGAVQRGDELRAGGIAYVCFEQARALCQRDQKLDDSEFRADAADPGTTVRSLLLGAGADEFAMTHWVQRLGIEHIQDRGLRFISTGEMRKTLLVAAILTEPQLLILDNPLDGLDRATQAEMARIIDELLASATRVLLLCRQPQDIPAGVSHVLVLDDGAVFASGTRNDILSDASVQALLQPPLPPLTALPHVTARPYELPGDGPLLALRGVHVRYGELAVLRDVDWTFERGQHCCISGPNGCGKTTLLSLVTGDNHKAYGQDITLFGTRRGSGESIWDIKQKYGQVDTQLHLNFARGMRVIEVVVSGFFDTVGLYDDWGDAQREAAQQWLAALGMADCARDNFDALSFGLQRMVLLARAMVKSPIILLLDEPTLGLDGHHRRLILRAIDHIAANSDTQVLFVSHCAGEMPACINQLLQFEPGADGFAVVCETR
ncbi:MAG: ATP-binding cassette domain-containing protein [Halioglobus sp.]|nr:ATP-binding cassette domain-containing protein [Halioglobus sp.]